MAKFQHQADESSYIGNRSDCWQVISVKMYSNYDLDKLKFIGKGTQGNVYKIDSERCIKIFKAREACQG